VPFLTSSGVLWAAITFLAVVAIRRRRAKSAEMRAEWEVEEELAEKRAAPTVRTPIDFGRKRSLDDADDEIVN
jgi:hypothetical protein